MSEFSKPVDYIVDSPAESQLDAGVIDEEELPLVSICIPTYNDEDTIERCLNSFATQSFPKIEIVIVDGYSEDKTVSIARQYTDKIHQLEGPLGEARQRSVDISSGDIVALFDGDIYLPHDDWLLDGVRYFNYDETVSTIWPRNIAPPNGTLTTRLYFNHWDVIMEDRISNNRGFFGGGNSLFRRDHLEEIGGVNPDVHWGEDFDWAKRLAEAGYRVVYSRDPVYHDTMSSLVQFTKKQFTGAETFSETGFGLMGMTLANVLYEQYVLGTKGMVEGLLRERDPTWSLFPLYIALRSLAYGYTFTRSKWKDLR